MSVLIDTNILLRRTQANHPQHTAAVESVVRLVNQGETVCFTPQNISEFWNVLTRPIVNNGFGLAVSQALVEIEKVEQSMTLLPDSPAIYTEWKRLVIKHSVLGSKVHDTKLVAAMIVHGMNKILTFNGNDFTRYGIEVLHPASVIA